MRGIFQLRSGRHAVAAVGPAAPQAVIFYSHANGRLRTAELDSDAGKTSKLNVDADHARGADLERALRINFGEVLIQYYLIYASAAAAYANGTGYFSILPRFYFRY